MIMVSTAAELLGEYAVVVVARAAEQLSLLRRRGFFGLRNLGLASTLMTFPETSAFLVNF